MARQPGFELGSSRFDPEPPSRHPELPGEPPPLPPDEPEYQQGYAAGLRAGRAQAFREIAQSRMVEWEIAARKAEAEERWAQEAADG